MSPSTWQCSKCIRISSAGSEWWLTPVQERPTSSCCPPPDHDDLSRWEGLHPLLAADGHITADGLTTAGRGPPSGPSGEHDLPRVWWARQRRPHLLTECPGLRSGAPPSLGPRPGLEGRRGRPRRPGGAGGRLHPGCRASRSPRSTRLRRRLPERGRRVGCRWRGSLQWF